MARALDEVVDDFRNRPLDRNPYTYVWADALFLKSEAAGVVNVNVALLHAVGANGDGHRKILGLRLSPAEDGAGRLAFWRSLVARGFPVSSSSSPTTTGAWWRQSEPLSPGRRGKDAASINAEPVDQIPKAASQMVATMVPTIFAQPNPDST